MSGYYDPDGYWVNTDDGADPLNEQKGFGSGAGTDVVTDPSGVQIATPSIANFLTPYKSLFDKIKSGKAGANEYAAAAGILGLLIPSLNKPKTAGWKGSIDLNKQFTRTPIAQPAYTPYAQSAAPVMGRQFFTSSYGAPGAAPAQQPATSGDTSGATSVTTKLTDQGLDPNSPGDSGGKAHGGIASLHKFEGGGDVEQPKSGPQFYDYHVGANARLVDVPGIEKPVLMFFDLANNRVVVSDEGYWNPNAPIGEDLNKAVSWARDQGLQAGVVVSPYSWDAFGKDAIGEATEAGDPHPRSIPPASFGQLKEYMNAADFVVTDPYVVSSQTATPGVQEKLTQITGMIGDYAQETNKPAWLVLGGSQAPKGTDPNTIYNYTDNLLANIANKFNQVSVYEGTRDGGDTTWDYLQAADIFAKNGIQPTGNYGLAFETRQPVPPTPALGYDIGSLKVGSVQDFLSGPNLQDPSNWGKQTGYLDPASELAKTLAEKQQPTATAPQQPAALAGLAGSLPSGWSGYGAEQKIDWFNQNRVTPEQLLGADAGVTPEDIDWMKGQGYLGSYDMAQPAAQPMYQPMAESSGPSQMGIAQLTSPPIPQTTQPPMPQPTPDQPRSPLPDFQLGQEDQIMAAQGGIMGYARGGKAMPPRYLRGETDGMQDKIPSNIDGVQPAKLSHGEFVIPADVVSHLGNGNSDAGAKVLYGMMDRVRKARTGTKKQGKQINPEKFTPGGIAGYAGGGAVAFQAGGVTDPKTSVGTSRESNISSWAGPYVGDMLSKTAALTSAPYQAYQGPMVAGTSPLQSKVFGGLESLDFPGQLGQSFTSQGAYQLPTMGAPGAASTGPTGIAAQYMNPYLSAVLTPQLEEMRRQSQITQMGTAGKLAQAGAFGGSRQAIMDAETQRNLLQEQSKAIGTGYANAYDRAMGQFNVEQGQAKTLADMMAGAGQQQRGIEQEGITALQKQYETEQLQPYTNLRFQKEMLQGLPVATEATTANTSTAQQAAGQFANIEGLMKALGLA